jgi:hypothetical protein
MSTLSIGASKDVPLFNDDVLKGAAAIGAFLGTSARQAFYLCERGQIPCGKLGASWIASKTVLREYLNKITRLAS